MLSIDFWGVEVKSGEPLKVEIGEGYILHVSQASLGEVKKDKGNASVCLYVKIGNKKLVLGTLSPEKFPQLNMDLVFEKGFELSHNSKDASVYFTGYTADQRMTKDMLFLELSGYDDESEEQLPAGLDNGKPESQALQTKPASEKAHTVKPDAAQAKQKVTIVEPNKDVKPDEETDDSGDDDDDDSTDDDDDDNDSSDDKIPQDMMVNSEDDEDDDSDDEDDDSDDEDEESDEEDEDMVTPNKNAELGKKRSADSAGKNPVPDKKAKLATPLKTDGKKGVGHQATPYPSKQVAKTPANSDKKKEQTPKTFACKSCSRSFGSENALQSHTKAKHAAA